MSKKRIKHKHVPQRTCVGCREVHAKRTLIRIVKTPNGVMIDPSGKMHGRGAYLHNQLDCWQRGLKGPLALALKTDLTDDDRNLISTFMNSLALET